MSTIQELLHARAGQMAEHDGAPVSAVYLVGATWQLQAELLTARDTSLAQLASRPAMVIEDAPLDDAATIEAPVAEQPHAEADEAQPSTTANPAPVDDSTSAEPQE